MPRHLTLNYVPPKSPFSLIQEQLFHDPWKLLIATVFLNKTAGSKAIPVLWQFLKEYPSPECVREGSLHKMAEILHSLGLHHKRAEIIKRFSGLTSAALDSQFYSVNV